MPSPCGRNAVVIFCSTPSKAHICFQKAAVNLESRSESTTFGSPCRRKISRWYRSASSSALSVTFLAPKCARLVSWSITIITMSKPRGVIGKQVIKSIATWLHRRSGIAWLFKCPGGGGSVRALVRMYTSQPFTYFVISRTIRGQ
ncbi:hypothetical protein PHYSODRAFT_510768 [Phytophthora sojae]|uniref:Uncharacterized protein n=1 Tax=Phytophthora sojae (strain P6497) TaxID=1094619 RepID=G4ZTM7_PHYSP|nr:hypothetical protein PHYSODRAFT_510768 [Phytophthora sojae]EGZ12938.1 hypothetical protein PHYSODRAFT_510768 [Phytophthora sojae]|eukprot:XP_009530367.1 hypothetical protein PHYSODRAFT_510768 [Phytophthora sojae]